MSSTFFGLNIAKSALSAQRRAMDVLAYNIANANDPTYKRQRLVLSENSVLAQSQEANPTAVSAFGSGVTGGDVERIRDALIENRLISATTAHAGWSYQAEKLVQIEAIIGEPSDSGLASDLNTFWDSWQTLANEPEDTSIRSSLLEDAQALCERFNYQFGEMKSMIDDLNLAMKDKVNRINLIGDEISRLNNEIGSLESGNIPINDLLNRRDALIQELSKLTAINQHGDSKDNFVISIGGRVLVQGTLFNKLTTETQSGTFGNIEVVEWESDGDPVVLTGGELQSIQELRDTKIPDYLTQLNNVASLLVDNVNLMHQGGYDLDGNLGNAFFMENVPPGTVTAANISLNTAMIGNPRGIAASSTAGSVGNNANAMNIYNIRNTNVYPTAPSTPTQTINDLYQAYVSTIGSNSATAERQTVANKLSLDQFTTQQQSISGVSLDEELTNMIKFQQAYNAASKVLSSMDEMLTTLISAVG